MNRYPARKMRHGEDREVIPDPHGNRAQRRAAARQLPGELMTPRKTIEFTVYNPKRKQVLYDRADLGAVLNIFLNWAEGNEWIKVNPDVPYGEIIDMFMTVMSGENVAPR